MGDREHGDAGPDQPWRPGASLRPLHREGRLAEPLETDLSALSPEQAATALVDRFVRTGYAEARVADPDHVRRMIRRDCRRRGVRVRTLAAVDVLVVIDEERHRRWLATEEGRDHQRRMDAAMIEAMNRPEKPISGEQSRGRSPGASDATVHQLQSRRPKP